MTGVLHRSALAGTRARPELAKQFGNAADEVKCAIAAPRAARERTAQERPGEKARAFGLTATHPRISRCYTG